MTEQYQSVTGYRQVSGMTVVFEVELVILHVITTASTDGLTSLFYQGQSHTLPNARCGVARGCES